jgi:hypothetical protein
MTEPTEKNPYQMLLAELDPQWVAADPRHSMCVRQSHECAKDTAQEKQQQHQRCLCDTPEQRDATARDILEGPASAPHPNRCS